MRICNLVLPKTISAGCSKQTAVEVSNAGKAIVRRNCAKIHLLDNRERGQTVHLKPYFTQSEAHMVLSECCPGSILMNGANGTILHSKFLLRFKYNL